MPRIPKGYGTWAMICLAIAYALTFASFVGRMTDIAWLYQGAKVVGGVFGFVAIGLLILFSHRVKMDCIEEAAENESEGYPSDIGPEPTPTETAQAEFVDRWLANARGEVATRQED